MKVKRGAVGRSIRQDLIVMVAFNLAMLYVFAKIDFIEWLYINSQQYEYLELDELIPLFISISISLVLFNYRRIRELKFLLSETEQLSTHDHLTGLYNRRYFQDAVYSEIRRSNGKSTNFSLIIIDIDDFKHVNDKFGHNSGDIVLTQFSKILVSATRRVDIVARWGGEEFIILCPETNLKEAEKTAKRLVETIETYRFDVVGHVTASLGAVIQNKGESFESTVNRADECLYQAKSQGKNCYMLGG